MSQGIQSRFPFISDDYAELYPQTRTMTRHFLIHAGGTNSGKTWKAVQDLEQAESGVYFGPLRLLAYEQYERMNHDQCPCSLVTGEEQIFTDGATHQSSTIEMFDETTSWDVAVIDEAQMIQDPSRGGSWTLAILGLQAKRIHLCCSDFAVAQLISMIEQCGDTYEIEHCQRKTPLVVETQPFLFSKSIRPHDALVAFSRRDVLAIANELANENIATSVIYGALPYSVRHKEAERFASGETQVVVATDAIGTGLNLPIERIVFMQQEKFDGQRRRPLLPQEVQQIAGRAGRYGQYPTGYVNSYSNLSFIDSCLHESVPEIKQAVIGFPKVLLQYDATLFQTMKLWQHSRAPEGYQKADLSRSLELCGLLQSYTSDKMLIYNFLQIPFNEKSDSQMQLWFSLFVQMVQGHPLQSFESAFPMSILSNLSTIPLNQLEQLYASCDILTSYFHRFQIPISSQSVQLTRLQLSDAINSILVHQSYHSKTCRLCGKPLPWDSPYGICQDCYESQWWGEEE